MELTQLFTLLTLLSIGGFGSLTCQVQIRLAKTALLSPGESHVFDELGGRKARLWGQLSLCGVFILNMVLSRLDSKIGSFVWLAFGIGVIFMQIFLYQNPCSDIREVNLPEPFIRRLALLRRREAAFTAVLGAAIVMMVLIWW